MIVVGFILSFIATLTIVFKGLRSRRAKAPGWGGLIMVGPIPIIFGTSKETVKIIVILSILLMILALIVILILGWLK
ncbi:DUF131 domain-containing protein [Candidatus Bathyarchaeota archaeon]|nr:DUF131 domain-containing protein [Candidatus Bathyarchaeota archaeon]